MSLTFWLVVLVVALAFRTRRAKREIKLLYSRGELVGDAAVFPCGCRYSISGQDRRLCQAHQAIIAAEVEA